MRRTTISLPDDMAQALEREARRRHVSVSQVTREALEARYRIGEGQARELPFAALGRSGAGSTARNAEDILAAEWPVDRDR